MAFNSNEYAWKDISINVLGRTLIGITEVKYKVAKGKEFLYGKGDNPLAIQTTNKAYTGQITLLQSELEALEDAAKTLNPLNDATDIAFDIIITYGVGIETRTDIVRGASLEEYEKGMTQGDPAMKVQLTFKARGVVRGV